MSKDRAFPVGSHSEHVAVRTRSRTARRGHVCGAFGRRLGLCLGCLLLAALSPRVGASLGGLVQTFDLLGQYVLGALDNCLSSRWSEHSGLRALMLPRIGRGRTTDRAR